MWDTYPSNVHLALPANTLCINTNRVSTSGDHRRKIQEGRGREQVRKFLVWDRHLRSRLLFHICQPWCQLQQIPLERHVCRQVLLDLS